MREIAAVHSLLPTPHLKVTVREPNLVSECIYLPGGEALITFIY
jgi:hypothetical protein